MRSRDSTSSSDWQGLRPVLRRHRREAITRALTPDPVERRLWACPPPHRMPRPENSWTASPSGFREQLASTSRQRSRKSTNHFRTAASAPTFRTWSSALPVPGSSMRLCGCSLPFRTPALVMASLFIPVSRRCVGMRALAADGWLSSLRWTAGDRQPNILG